MFSGNQYGNHEVTYTWNRGEQKEFWLLVLRLYLSGNFDDTPPPDVILPPFLAKKGTEVCCSLMWTGSAADTTTGVNNIMRHERDFEVYFTAERKSRI